MPTAVRYFVFDVESVADGDLVAKIRYDGRRLSGPRAIAKYRKELLEKYDHDFIPYTYQTPVAVAIAKVAADYRLIDLVNLDEPDFRPHVITEHFWRGWEKYRQPTWVSFNGRTFDLPLLELAAFRYGVSVPKWFATSGRGYEQPRSRYNVAAHLDLLELFTNFGATRFHGGLNLAANLLGKPGKMDVQGHMVQDLFEAGKLREINDYCRLDTLDTYFVFLRSRVLVGDISLDEEQALVEETRQWLEQRAGQTPAYSAYLEKWGGWKNPWSEGEGS